MKPEHDVKTAIVPVDSIEVGNRFRKNYGDVKKLVESIKENGLIQGLAVVVNGEGYKLLAGGRRLQACKEAEMKEVPVRIYPNEISSLRRKAIELAENAVRENMTWQEQDALTKEVHRLYTTEYGESGRGLKEGWTIQDTANMLGVSRTQVTRSIKMAEVMENVPAIAHYKNRDEAEKIIEKTTKLLQAEEIQRKIEDERNKSAIPIQKRKLVNSYIVGDFLELSRKMPDGCCQIAEVDPPYGIDLHQLRRRVYSDVSIDSKYKEVPYENYAEWLLEVVKECFRLLASGGWMILWYGIDPYQQVCVDVLRTVGFEVRGIPGIWYKGQGYGQTMHPEIYLGSSTEYFLYARKHKATIQKQGRSNVFEFKPIPPLQKSHPTERPIEMIQELLDTFATRDAVVAVPFLGSGNTLLAASNLGMKGFGYDLSEEYKSLYASKVNNGEAGKYRSYKEE